MDKLIKAVISLWAIGFIVSFVFVALIGVLFIGVLLLAVIG